MIETIEAALSRQDFPGVVAGAQRRLQTHPTCARTWSLLAAGLAGRGEINEAGKSLVKAIACEPRNPDHHVQMGDLYTRIDRPADAGAAYARALAMAPEHPRALHGLAAAQWAQGKLDEADKTYQRLLALDPDEPFAQRRLRLLRGQMVPRWHFPMVADGARNREFEAALVRAIRADTIVLDIGAGTGLLSMLAARAGARHVFACESNPAMAALARRIVADNGFAERITVLDKPSYAIDPVRDFAGFARPDLLVAEVFDATVIGEGALSTFAHAHANLLAPGARSIPCRARLYGVLIESERQWHEGCARDAAGFDVSALNRYRPDCVGIEAAGIVGRPLSDDFLLFEFDLTRVDPEPARRADVEVAVRAEGECHGVLYWMQLVLDEHSTLDNRPDLGEGVGAGYCAHWHQMLRLFSSPLALLRGDTLRLRAEHDRMAVALSLRAPVTNEPGM